VLRPSVGGTIKLKVSIACHLRASATFPCGCGEDPLSFGAIAAVAAGMAGFVKLTGQAGPLRSFLSGSRSLYCKFQLHRLRSVVT
jgi:hypothetical protein